MSPSDDKTQLWLCRIQLLS